MGSALRDRGVGRWAWQQRLPFRKRMPERRQLQIMGAAAANWGCCCRREGASMRPKLPSPSPLRRHHGPPVRALRCRPPLRPRPPTTTAADTGSAQQGHRCTLDVRRNEATPVPPAPPTPPPPPPPRPRRATERADAVRRFTPARRARQGAKCVREGGRGADQRGGWFGDTAGGHRTETAGGLT